MKTNSTHLTLVLFICVFVQAMAFSGSNAFDVPKGEAEKIKAKLNSGEFSLGSFAFVENKGQVYGYDGLPHPEVKFSFQQGNTQIFLLERGLAYQFTKMHYPEGYQEMIRDKGGRQDMEKMTELQKQIRTETFRMDMTLVGVNNHVKITTEGRSADYTNYYNRDVLDIHAYSKVTYHNIYPGINWVIYTKGTEVKYDFIVKPGADPSLIKMQFHHQEDLSLNRDGSFTLKNSLGSITEKSPDSFQSGRRIGTQFILDNNLLSFDLENYNHQETLIIDPALVWATYYGGTTSDYGNSCSIDVNGNVYMVGYTYSTGNIALGGHQNTFGGSGNADAFLVKFNSTGVRQWSTYYGSSSSDSGWSCAIDGTGNVYIAGLTQSTAGISSGGHQNNFGGSQDAFLVKFNPSGIRQWATYYGGTNSDFGKSCATDVSGNVYLTGATQSTAGIASGGHQNTHGGASNDAYLVKFNSSGVRQWATYYGGSGNDVGNCVTESAGSVYLTGVTQSASGISSGGHQNTFGGNLDAYLVKFNSSGVRQWATYYGSIGSDYVYSCALDALGNIYMAGSTNSPGNIASGGHQNSIGGSDDAILVKFNPSGVMQWATYYGGAGYDVGESCTTDVSGNVYLAGAAQSSLGISSGGYQNNFGGQSDAFLVKFTSLGVRQWGTYYGSTGYDYGYSCCTDGSGNVYLAGYTTSTVNIASGGHQNVLGGGGDAFLAKLCNVPDQPGAISGSTQVCMGSSQSFSFISVPFAASYSWSVPVGGWSGTSTTNIISVTAGASGIFSVSAINACGVSVAQTINITSNPSPTITVNSGSICQGNSFTINPSGASSYTIQGGNSIVSPTTSASYSVMGSSSLGCLSQNFATANITVNLNPTITVNSGSICEGNSFTIVPAGANTYTIQGANAVVSPNTNTSFSVFGTSIEGCMSQNFATANVTVNVNPTITVNSGTICSSQSFTIVPSGANTYTIQGGNAVVSPNTNASYTITGISSEGCLSVNTATSHVTVYATPTLSINNGTICSGQSFTIVPSGASTYTIQGGNPLVSPNTSASYTVSGSSSDGCLSANTATSNVNVNPLPVINISASSTIICEGESINLSATGAYSYTWSTGANSGSISVSPVITTTYSATGQDTNACENTSAYTLQVDECTGIANTLKSEAGIMLYPNPNNGMFYIETSQSLAVRIYNSLGQLIIQQKLSEGKNQINLNEHANGIYFIEINQNDKTNRMKLIKE